MRKRRERAALPKPPEPKQHSKPEFCNDDDPTHEELRKQVEAFIARGGTIKRLPAQEASLQAEEAEIMRDIEDVSRMFPE